jgi:hypothetical protein
MVMPVLLPNPPVINEDWLVGLSGREKQSAIGSALDKSTNVGQRFAETTLEPATLSLAEQGLRYLRADTPQARHAVLVEPMPDIVDVPRRLGYLADLAAASANDDAQRADAALLRAAEMVTRGLTLDAIRGAVAPHRDHFSTENLVHWIVWLYRLGTRNNAWRVGLTELSKAILPTCISMGIA